MATGSGGTSPVKQQISGDSRPTLKLLQSGNITVKVSSKWYELGIELLDDDQLAQLRVITANYNDVTRQCSELFIYWLRSHPNATWYQLVAALRAPGIEMNDVAATLEGQFSATTESLISTTSGTPARQEDGRSSTHPEDFSKYGSVSEAFVMLQTRIEKILMNVKIESLRRACIVQQKTPGGVQLSEKLETEILSKPNVDSLLDLLVRSSYWSWIDIRLLQAIVTASDIPQASQILENYKSAIFPKKLVDVLPSIPNREIKDKFFAKIAAKLKKDASVMTVADLLEYQSQLETVIMDVGKGVCVLKHIKKGCLEVQWYIPSHYVESAYKSASIKRHLFNEVYLLRLQIAHHPVIHDPLSTPNASTPDTYSKTADGEATLKDFIHHYYDYLSVNMDPEVVVQLMISQQLFSEDLVMTAQSYYHKNCLILEQVRLMDIQTLFSFCELLKGDQSHREIGETLFAALATSGLLISTYTTSDIEQDQQYGVATAGKVERKDVDISTMDLEPSSVVLIFLDVKVHLLELLQEVDPKKITEHCGSLKASKEADILLFTSDLLDVLKESKTTPKLIHKLAPYTNWCDHSILNTIIEVCNVPEAKKLITEFDAKIDPSQPLMEYPIPSPSHHMVPYDTSTHTVLAVQLNLQLHHSTLQTVLNTRSLLQQLCHISGHCLQLLAVANTSHTIIYWTIPKHVAGLIISNVLQHQNYLHQYGIQQVAVYPGTTLVTGSALTVGLFSFFTEAPTNTSDSLSVQLYQLEEIPKNLNKLQVELLETRREQDTQLYQIAVQINHNMKRFQEETTMQVSDQVNREAPDTSTSSVQLLSFQPSTTLKTIQSSLDQLMVQLRHSRASEMDLKDKICKEKQKYFNLWSQYRELQSTSESPQVVLDTSQHEEHDELEELPTSQLLDADTMTELTKLQFIVEDLSSCLAKVEVIGKYWSKKSVKSTQPQIKEHDDLKDCEPLAKLQSIENPLLNQLKYLNSNLTLVKEWPGLFDKLKTELSDSKGIIEILERELIESSKLLFDTEAKLAIAYTEAKKAHEEMSIQQEGYKVTISQLKEELSEKDSQLMMKEDELTKIKEDNKLLVKQFRERKDKKRSETISQDQLVKQKLLGSGRYGEVWRMSYGDKTYAGKIIHKTLLPGYPDTSVDQMNQFVADIENVSATFISHSHPYIEKFFTVVQPNADGPPILLTELLHDNLNSFTAKMKGKLPINIQIDLCYGMARGVQFLHENGVIHNNLHGGNVLITQDGHANIGDYVCPQIAEINENVTAQHKVYMSPEATKNTFLCSKPSDIYSLGVTFLQVATQSPPAPKKDITLSDIQKYKLQLEDITGNPLLPVIIQCLNILPARPPINRLCDRISTAKETPQYVISSALQQVKDSPEFGLSLLSNKYKIKWTKCNDLPVAMRGQYSTIIDDVVYIGGGLCSEDNDEYYIFMYNLKENKWTRLPTRLPQIHGVVVNINKKITVIGGVDSIKNRATNKVITLQDHHWTSLYGDMNTAKLRPAVIPHQHYTIVAGGLNDHEVVMDTIEVFDGEKWMISKTCLPKPMWAFSATVCNNSLIIAGFGSADGYRNKGVYITTMDNIINHTDYTTRSFADDNKWTPLAPAPYWNTIIVPHTTPPVIVGGSKQGETTDAIMAYDDSTNSWSTISSLPIKCSWTTILTLPHSIFMAGGTTDTTTAETAKCTSLTSVMIGELVQCD